MTEFLDELPGVPKAVARHRVPAPFAEDLRANPGKWAAYPLDIRQSKTLAWSIRKGKVACFAAGFDADVREGVVYVRYIGGES